MIGEVSIYLEVAVPVPLRRRFHYLPPPATPHAECLAGSRIEVPFGRQKLVGIVLGTVATTDLPENKLKRAHRLIDTTPVFSESMFSLCLWASDYYHHPIGEVMHTALPVLLRKGEPATAEVKRLVALWQTSDQLSSAPRQKALLNNLIAAEERGLEAHELQDFAAPIIKAVIEKGAAEWRTSKDNSQMEPPAWVTPTHLEPSREQIHALDAVQKTGTHLLFGITGSGKTEIYLQAIAKTLASGKQALVLVPEIGLTPQTIKRFENRFKVGVVAMHSALNNRERLEAWREANSGKANIVIGTRSAIFTPLKNPGLIVIDEEHDGSFKQQDGFRYSARDLAVLRGQREKLPVILGSATPSLESYANALAGKYQLVKLTERANTSKPANFKIIGTEHQPLTEGISSELEKMIRQHLEADRQVLVFLNRRGFSPVLHCRQCLWLSNCHRCDAKMTYHLSTKRLVCHHCGNSHQSPRHCPDCQSQEIVPLGLGTQRLEAGLQQLFPEETIIRIDRDSTRQKNALNDKINAATKGQRSILLGTQLLAKGHHFPNVTLVAIIDLDAGFYSSDYHAIERTGQLLLQVSGRSGREQLQGTVAIQTLFPQQPMLNCLINDGYDAFAAKLLAERESFELPPYVYQAVIRADAHKPKNAMDFLQNISEQSHADTKVDLLGPIPAPMEKRAGKHRAQLLVSSGSRRDLHQLLRKTVQIAEQSELASSVRWSIDVDPFDLF